MSNGIHASGSATSLTHLADTGCFFCSEAEGETGERLYKSKLLVKCECSFMVHLSCWNKYIETAKERVCPSCHKHLSAPYLIKNVSEEHEDEKSAPGISRKAVAGILLIFLCCLAFIIAMLVSSKGS